jgi:vacuolar protein sorting-associated protein 45
MTSFVEALPEYSHQQGVTWKHVTLMSELSHAVDRRGLMRVSGVEQDIACQAPSVAAHYDAVHALVNDTLVQPTDKLRLVLLYALRYEREGHAQIAALWRQLEEWGVAPDLVAAGRTMLRQCCAERRVMDVFLGKTLVRQNLEL